MSDGQGSFRAPPVEELQKHFSQYRIDRFVAVGGMGAVYRATQISVDRPVALKILPPEMAKDQNFCDHFVMEARAMAKLSHRNLVQLYDFGETNGIFWMIQEWVEGRTIFDVMHEEQRLSPEEAAALVAQACEGLGYAHKQGIVHRDVKPANMMVDGEGILKLMDFGLARVGGEGMRSQSGKRFATEEYAAPELWDLKAKIDHRADIFALGVLLYEALTGKRPTGTFRMPSELRPELDPRFNSIVVRAMQGDREGRYNSCAELLSALRAVVTSPGKVKLQTARPTTDVLRLNTPPVQAPPLSPGKNPPATEGISGIRLASPGIPERKKSRVPMLILGLLLLLGLLAGGWVAFTKAGKKKPAKEATPEEPASGTSAEGTGGVEPLADPAGKKEELVGGTQPPQPGPPGAGVGEEPAPEPVDEAGELLRELDEGLRRDAAQPLGAYLGALAEARRRYVAGCREEEEKAVAAGDLDEVLFWQDEVQAGEAEEVPAPDESVPERAAVLRQDWWTEVGPSREVLVSLHTSYLEACSQTAEASESPESRELLATRVREAANFRNFLLLCQGKAPPFPSADGEATDSDGEADIATLLPAKILANHEAFMKQLAELENSGAHEEMVDLIKSYGRMLVRDEKALTQERNIEGAKALRRIKEQMLVRLKESNEPGEPTPANQPPVRRERVEIIARGVPTDLCVYDRKQWRRKSRALVTGGVDRENGIYPSLTVVPSLGPGDFRIDLRMNVARIGATGLQLWLGETAVHLDDENGRVALHASGASIAEVRGASLGAMAAAGSTIEVRVLRSGRILEMVINGKPALKATIHERELGQLRLYAGSASLNIEELSIDGSLRAAPRTTIVGPAGRFGWSKGVNQLLGTGGQGLTALFLGHEKRSTVWARRSRDGGAKWTDVYAVVPEEVLRTGIQSFGAVFDQRRDQIHMLLAVGKASQRVYLVSGRSGGRNWSKPVEITGMVAEPGWNLALGGQGLMVRHGKNHPGRIVLPMLVGTEKRSLYLLVSDTGGRQWGRVGPLADVDGTGAELMEDYDGTLWLAARPAEAEGEFRMLMASRDGGQSWSAPQDSTIPHAATRGALAPGLDHEDRPVWYYAGSEVIVDEEGGRYRTHLTLYGSRDQGKSWRELRRVHFGGWSHPSIVSLGPERCGITFRRLTHHANHQEIRFVAAERFWAE